MEFYSGIPPLLVQFIMTVAFSFVVGLEFRSYHHANDYKLHFGSTRTFVLIGVLGFILYTRLLFAKGRLCDCIGTQQFSLVCCIVANIFVRRIHFVCL